MTKRIEPRGGTEKIVRQMRQRFAKIEAYSMTVGLAADRGGFSLIEETCMRLRNTGFEAVGERQKEMVKG